MLATLPPPENPATYIRFGSILNRFPISMFAQTAKRIRSRMSLLFPALFAPIQRSLCRTNTCSQELGIRGDSFGEIQTNNPQDPSSLKSAGRRSSKDSADSAIGPGFSRQCKRAFTSCASACSGREEKVRVSKGERTLSRGGSPCPAKGLKKRIRGRKRR